MKRNGMAAKPIDKARTTARSRGLRRLSDIDPPAGNAPLDNADSEPDMALLLGCGCECGAMLDPAAIPRKHFLTDGNPGGLERASASELHERRAADVGPRVSSDLVGREGIQLRVPGVVPDVLSVED